MRDGISARVAARGRWSHCRSPLRLAVAGEARARRVARRLRKHCKTGMREKKTGSNRVTIDGLQSLF